MFMGLVAAAIAHRTGERPPDADTHGGLIAAILRLAYNSPPSGVHDPSCQAI